MSKNDDTLFVGEVVKGYIAAIAQEELIVDIGTKHTGYAKRKEVTDKMCSLSQIFSIGDELEFIIKKVNNRDGIVWLTLKSYIDKLNQKKNHHIVDNVISQVQNGLSEMKPAIISEIVSSVYEHIEKSNDFENQALRKRISELEERVAQLETIIDRIK